MNVYKISGVHRLFPSRGGARFTAVKNFRPGLDKPMLNMGLCRLN